MRVLFSREFWRGFTHFWSGPEVSHRIDLWVARLREGTGQEPDLEVQRRINEYRQKKEQNTGIGCLVRLGRVGWSPDYVEPPKADPCIVDLYFTGGWGRTKKRVERAWIEARKCPRGCGEKCKRLDT